jgi:class 3 adenylate cyclase
VDIAAWLRELRLERYQQAFRENEIDAEILPKLTADDLKDIGVTVVGHRRKLLEAISVLAEPALASQAEQSAPGEAATAVRPAAAERRQLTVMFADLVGSTALAARLDPEETRDIIRDYQDAVAGAVALFGGRYGSHIRHSRRRRDACIGHPSRGRLLCRAGPATAPATTSCWRTVGSTDTRHEPGSPTN